MSRIPTKFTELLGIKYPICISPLHGISGENNGAVASTTTATGGFGCLGITGKDIEWIENEWNTGNENLKESHFKRMGMAINLSDILNNEDKIENILKLKPSVIWLCIDVTSFSSQVMSSLIKSIHQSSCAVFAHVTTKEEALKLLAWGSDAISVGGSSPEDINTSFSLIPKILSTHPNSILLATGENIDGRSMTAAVNSFTLLSCVVVMEASDKKSAMSTSSFESNVTKAENIVERLMFHTIQEIEALSETVQYIIK